MEGDPAVQQVIDAALRETELEPLLAALIRHALGKRWVLEAAREELLREAGGDEGSRHAAGARRLDRALAFRNLWAE